MPTQMVKNPRTMVRISLASASSPLNRTCDVLSEPFSLIARKWTYNRRYQRKCRDCWQYLVNTRRRSGQQQDDLQIT